MPRGVMGERRQAQAKSAKAMDRIVALMKRHANLTKTLAEVEIKLGTARKEYAEAEAIRKRFFPEDPAALKLDQQIGETLQDNQ